jgi:hypothetical protein
MKISGVDIRPGNIIEYEGGIWRAERPGPPLFAVGPVGFDSEERS